MTIPHTIRYLLIAITVGASAACSMDGAISSPVVNGSDLFWAVESNHRAVTMQVGQQLQLQATAITPLGTPIPSVSETVTVISTDTARIQVTPTGLMTARDVGSNIMVIATAHSDAQNVTNADTVYVNVTTDAPQVASFSFPTDSLKIAATEGRNFPVVILATNGDTIKGASIRYYTSDPKKLDINRFTGALDARNVGTVKLRAVATLYGTTWTDSVEMTVTPPIAAYISISHLVYQDPSSPLYFSATDLTVRKGAVVRFTARTTVPLTITFDNPAGVTGGNISLPGTMNAFEERTFNTVGTFTFQSQQFAGSGKITVVP